MKVVINKCYGGFGLSPKAIKRYLELKGKECFFYEQIKYSHQGDIEIYKRVNSPDNRLFLTSITKDLGEIVEGNDKIFADGTYFYYGDLERTDPILVQVVEELGSEANGWAASLYIADIPDDISWEIDDYDGIETIHESHRSW